ncbi:MAG: NAD(+)/NADH kinase [Candidatus Eisenbacteria bacterium]|nr:NAD(+)/NADH kinase [Candidatus Eisenbacteria bacterium]
MKNVGIVANLNKENALGTVKEIVQWLEQRGTTAWLEERVATAMGREGFSLSELPSKCELMVALGGDGTLLAVARHACRARIPLLGVNLGGLGFLTELTVPEVIPTLEKIGRGQLLVEERMMLEARVEDASGQVTSRYACLNDAVMNKSAFSRAVQINMWVSDFYVGTFLADGLIVSTPTGSTAYALSAGGPVMKPTIRALIATPICPHTLAVRPLIFSEDEELKIEVLADKSEVTLTMDGQEGRRLARGEKALFRKANESTLLVRSGDRSFYEVLRTKLGWGGLAKR